MSAVITEPIPQQNFELVNAQLGAIVKLELDNQKALHAANLPNDHEVYLERDVPYDQSEDVVAMVSFDNSNYEQQQASGQSGPCIYNIDLYGQSKYKPESRGDELAGRLVQRYLGMVRYILSSTKYNTLGFQPGFVGGVNVQRIQMYQNEGHQDARSVRMGRLVVGVRVYEGQQLWDGVNLNVHNTQVKLDLTDKGYKYELITA